MKNVVPVLLLLAFATGCATVPYKHGRNIESTNVLKLRPGIFAALAKLAQALFHF